VDRIESRSSLRTDFLNELLRTYWFAPSVALWRAVELRVAAQQSFPRPLLDLGCGDGLIAQALFRDRERVDAGCDPWPAQIRRAYASGIYKHLALAYGNHLPYADASFASVFSNSVLEHIPDVEPVVREAARVLMPGGTLIFTVPSEAFRSLLDGYQRRRASGDIRGAEAYARSVDTLLEHHHYNSPEQWRDILGKARMTLLRAKYYIPEATERAWDRMNWRFGIGRRWSLWRALASPRLRPLGYQVLLRKAVHSIMLPRLRYYYELDVEGQDIGGGLLVVARREAV
jgi:SAM-dependent methyltransferase